MKVVAINDSFADAPSDLLGAGFWPESQTHVTIGNRYEVFGISVFPHLDAFDKIRRVVCYLIHGDCDWPVWEPWFLFEIVDGVVRTDWQANAFPSGIFVVGPQFIVESEEAYTAMVEGHPAAIERFYAELQGAHGEER